MASRKLVRDVYLSGQRLFLHPTSLQGSRTRLLLPSTTRYSAQRGFGVFGEFSKKLKGEVTSNQEFQQSVKELKEKAQELKEKAEELKGVKEDLKLRTKQTTEQLYKHVDGVWTEAEATAKKVSSNVKEKIAAAKEEVKESFSTGKQEASESSGTSDKDGANGKGDESKASSSKDKEKSTSDDSETLFGKFRSSIPSSKVFQRLKEAKVTDFVKKGYDVVKDEIYGNPNQRKRLEYTPPPSFKGETSSRKDITVLPSKESRWNKTWGAFREKVRSHPVFKRFGVFSKPLVIKTHEIAEDVRERWETSDNRVVHKIQNVSDTIFQETDSAATIKEISRRDPSFSLMEFVAEVQEAVRPVLNAYIKGDVEILKKYCTPEVITRCEAEHKAFQSHGIFFDNKILHISDVELRETKMMGTSPIIILAFQTQQVHCVRDKNGAITEGGKDTIHTVYYAWAMQQIDPEEVGEGAIYPIWKLREIQQLGVQALI